jgi:MFS family permease
VVSTEVPPLRRDARVMAWVFAASLSRAGDVAWFIGLAWTAARVSGPTGAGLVMGIGSAPRACVLLLGGALADRMDARRTMVIANLARIAVLAVAVVVIGARGSSLGLLLVIAVIFGLVDALYDPASGTMPRRLVRDDDLAAVASMFQLGSRIATLVGAPVGGVLVATGGISLVMVADALTFVVIAGVLAAWLRPRFVLPRSQGHSVKADLVDGFRYLKRDSGARSLTIAVCGLNVFVGPITAVGVVLRTNAESWGAASLGLFEACIGAAAAVGAVIAIRWKPSRMARTGLLMLVGQAAACAAVGFAPYVGVIAAMLTIGLTAGLASAFLSGAFQRTVQPEYLGRTGSMVMLSDDALMPLAMTGFGALAAGLGLMATCALTGAGFAALVLWSASRPDIDRRSAAPPAATDGGETGATGETDAGAMPAKRAVV